MIYYRTESGSYGSIARTGGRHGAVARANIELIFGFVESHVRIFVFKSSHFAIWSRSISLHELCRYAVGLGCRCRWRSTGITGWSAMARQTRCVISNIS